MGLGCLYSSRSVRLMSPGVQKLTARSRVLRRLDTQVSNHFPQRLSRETACCTVFDGWLVRSSAYMQQSDLSSSLPPTDFSANWRIQLVTSVPPLAVGSPLSNYSRYTSHFAFRPKEHHVFDVLHFLKTAFKKHALDAIKESDCLNKEAYR